MYYTDIAIYIAEGVAQIFENQTYIVVGNVKFLCMVQNSKHQACIISWSLVTFLWPNNQLQVYIVGGNAAMYP